MMNLHTKSDEFTMLIRIAAENSGISADILEKDYYVCLMLQELALKKDKVRAYFKGGTCLYKIYAPMHRFSEDIDLTVQVQGLTNSQAKKHLELASKKFESLILDENNIMNENKKGSITQVYRYTSCFSVPDDPLQRFEKVKVEATSFTLSEPVETNSIYPLLLDCLPQNIAETVQKEYDIQTFEIQNITLERIFCDKILAAEFYLQRKDYFDVAKHLYDIATMIKMPRIKALLGNDEALIKALSYKRIEETKRIGSNLFNKPFSEFSLFSVIKEHPEFLRAYDDMQNKYIFYEDSKQRIEDIENILSELQELLLTIDCKEQEELMSTEFSERVEQYNPDFVFPCSCTIER